MYALCGRAFFTLEYFAAVCKVVDLKQRRYGGFVWYHMTKSGVVSWINYIQSVNATTTTLSTRFFFDLWVTAGSAYFRKSVFIMLPPLTPFSKKKKKESLHAQEIRGNLIFQHFLHWLVYIIVMAEISNFFVSLFYEWKFTGFPFHIEKKVRENNISVVHEFFFSESINVGFQ